MLRVEGIEAGYGEGAGAVRRRSRSGGRRGRSAARSATAWARPRPCAGFSGFCPCGKGAHFLRGVRSHQRAALRQGAARPRPRSGRAAGIPDAHGGGRIWSRRRRPASARPNGRCRKSMRCFRPSRRATIKHFGDQLSGGEQQMLYPIGRALMTNPKLLVFDEATEAARPADPRPRDLGLPRRIESERQNSILVHRQEHRRAAAHRRSTRGAGKGTRRMARHEHGIQGQIRRSWIAISMSAAASRRPRLQERTTR